MSASPFDPLSPNALFARIIERLDTQDRTTLTFQQDIKQTLTSYQTAHGHTEARVHSLERAQWRQRGFVAAIAFAVPLLWQLLTGSPSK